MQHSTHFITFYTKKYPAIDLSQEERFLKETIAVLFDSYVAYSPETVDSIYTKQYDYLNAGEHSRGCFHGFWAWKPHIILKRLLDTDIKPGDIVVYSDCNITRYKERINDFLNLRETTKTLFDNISCDFLISKDHNGLIIKHHVKLEVMKKIIGSSWARYLKHPLLHANRVFVRKSDISIKILKQWESYCLDESLLLPTLPERSPLRWHTHDQAIITALTKKLVLDRVLPSYWPGFCYDYNMLIPTKKIIFDKIKNNRIFYDT